MSQSRITVNLKCNQVADWGACIALLKRLDPVFVVACIDNKSDSSRIYELQKELPNTKIIARYIIIVKNSDGSESELDGGMHLAPKAVGDTRRYVVSPGDFLNTWGYLGQDGRSLYTINEPQATDASEDDIQRLVQWSIEVIGLATARGISLTWGNFGVGNPMLLSNGQYDARFDDVLTVLSKQRELHSLGMHCYMPVDIDGRLNGMIARCKAINITPPRTYITEFNYDAAFQGDPLSGHLSRGYTGDQFANREIDVLRNVYQPYISEGNLEGFATFEYAALDARFAKAFNVDSDKSWQDTILTAKDAGKLTIDKKTTKPAVTIPAALGIPKTVIIQGSASWNLRVDADPTAAQVGLVKVGESITIYPSTITSRVNNWYFVERASVPAGESATGWIAYVLPVTAPLPAPAPVPDQPAPFLEISNQRATQLRDTYRQLAAAHKTAAEAETLLAQDYLTLADSWDSIVQQTAVSKAA